MATFEERFWSKVAEMASGCWEWQGAKFSNGYGHFQTRDASLLVHRVSYELMVGAIPDGLVLDHLCRNRSCVNPDHLQPVTKRENTLRGETLPASHSRATHCPHGHPYDENNTYHEKNGARKCRICRLEYMRRYRAAHKVKN